MGRVNGAVALRNLGKGREQDTEALRSDSSRTSMCFAALVHPARQSARSPFVVMGRGGICLTCRCESVSVAADSEIGLTH